MVIGRGSGASAGTVRSEVTRVEAEETAVHARPGSFGRSLGDACAAFLKLGLISFGGPIAHLGYFHTEFVQKRRWLDDAAFADLVALCQFLPGPASSQVVFALGMRRAGLTGAIGASICFLLPSAIPMIALGYGVSSLGELSTAGWIHGLKLAAVAVVSQAVWMMGTKLCPDRPRLSICLVAAGLVLAIPGSVVQVGTIAAGAAAGWLLYRRAQPALPSGEHARPRTHRAAVGALVAFVALLIVPPLVAKSAHSRDVSVFEGFYRSGSLVFGGGHVVLPLLRAEVVPNGWVSDDAFLAGYGAAQALPGPLFSFAGYLGAIIYAGPRAWVGGLWCLLAIFLPAWLIIGGALPFWHALRAKAWAQSGLRGANAAVVGVLLSALYSPLMTEGIAGPNDAAACLLAFGLLQVWRVPPLIVVLGCAAAGEWWLC